MEDIFTYAALDGNSNTLRLKGTARHLEMCESGRGSW